MTHVFDSNTCNPALDIVTIKNRFNELYTVLISIGRFTPFIKSDRIDFLTYFTVAGCPRRCLLTTKWFFAMRKKNRNYVNTLGLDEYSVLLQLYLTVSSIFISKIYSETSWFWYDKGCNEKLNPKCKTLTSSFELT